jgi:hypothetical protein
MAKKIPVQEYPVGPAKKDLLSEERWWEVKKSEGDKVAAHVFAIVNRIRENQNERRLDWLRYARLYANKDIDATLSGLPRVAIDRRLSFNVTKGNVNTACAKISKAKPRPLFLTTGGVYSQKKRAKKLTQYMDGVFTDCKVYRHTKKAFRDAAIFGTGLVKAFTENGKVKVERVFPDEVVVDDIDGREGEPQELHHVIAVPKRVLEHAFKITGDKLKALSMAKTASELYKANDARINERVVVIESWKLPSAEGADDGRHTISVSNETILDEKWVHKFFPFAVMRWEEALLGFWGEGIASQLVGIQLEINNVLQRIKESLETVAIPRVFVEDTAGVSISNLTDEIGGIVKYRGAKPEFSTPRGLGQESYDFLEYLYNKSFQETGISQLSAQSKKPAGLDSGVALREFQDIETERFVLVGEAWQDLHLDLAYILIALQRDLEESGEKQKVKVKGKGFIETINWKDVDMEDDKFIMSAFPTNFLPRTPEGQLQFTQELVQSGFCTQEEAMSLLNFPDLERFFNLRTAAMDDIEKMLEDMLEHGKYQPPEPYTDLKLALRMSQSALLRAKADGVSEDNLELVRRFMEDVQNIIVIGTPPPPVAPVPNAGPGAIGAAAPPPVSDLIPIQP